ncbi:MAG: HepT-like ribonuclease domain-containing protein [Trueperaceae bacterium]
MPSRTATVLRQMRQALEWIEAGEPDVDWTGLASLGNVLRHEYQRVDPVLLWTLLTDELASLSGALQRMENSALRDG